MSNVERAGLDELLGEAERAHGHLCAGQILGVRMAMLALRELGVGDPRVRFLEDGSLNPDRKRLVVFVEIDRCATDAIGVVTAARVGKRALKLRDWGKMAATFVDLERPMEADHYAGVRIVAHESSKARAKELYQELEKNVQQMTSYREMPDPELFSLEWVRVPLPPSEFPGYRGERVVCAECGEGVNFDRWVTVDGAKVCLSCGDKRLRYYEVI